MEVKLNTNIDSVARVLNTQPKASRPIESPDGDSAFETSRALEAHLEELPDIREAKVDSGRRLVGDPEYPPRETIQRIAALLAIQLDPVEEE